MDIEELILRRLHKQGKIKASEIITVTGFSRAYVNRFFQKLKEEGRILLIGKANKAQYIPATKQALTKSRKNMLGIRHILQNKNLSEDIVLEDIKKNSGIFLDMPKNTEGIINYAFLEMLNNAIEHSMSDKIVVNMKKELNRARFEVIDKGVGIFNNIMQKKRLNSEMDAIQDLLKGRQTTSPRTHSGEGVFFTSKVADILTIKSHRKQLIFNNILNDIFIRDIKSSIGTKVIFSININAKRRLSDIFRKYTDNSFNFSNTQVTVKLYKMGSEYISRSQARRIVVGLDKFKTIVLDFKGVKMVGQGFADEIFRVWNKSYPAISIQVKNANDNIKFMINRALSNSS